jgi:hypothetical protein
MTYAENPLFVSTFEFRSVENRRTMNDVVVTKRFLLVLDLDQTVIFCLGEHVTEEIIVNAKTDEDGDDTDFANADFELEPDPSNPVDDPFADCITTNEELGMTCSERAFIFYTFMTDTYIRFVAQPRPGLRRFIREVARDFDLAICSLGSDEYVESIVHKLDNDKCLFGNRVLARSSFPDQTKRLPEDWYNKWELIIILDDQPAKWEDARRECWIYEIVPYNILEPTKQEKAGQRRYLEEVLGHLNVWLINQKFLLAPDAVNPEPDDETPATDVHPPSKRYRIA